MCGLIGIVSDSEAKWALYEALNVVQHRGQDAAGMAICERHHFCSKKGIGLARDVFDDDAINALHGTVGIGHVRYPTAGSHNDPHLAQPFYVNYPYGIFLAHNGNLTNSNELKGLLKDQHQCHINTDSDSEVMINVFAQALCRHIGQARDKESSIEAIFATVKDVYRQCRGAYSVVVLLCGHGLLAFRDPHGIRPLVFGRQEHQGKTRYMFSSESVALDVLGYEMLRDVAPGEAIYVESDSLRLHKRQCADTFDLSPCIFEHVYLARPDSVMDGVLLHRARINQGKFLAENILRTYPDHDIDVVIPVPDTGRTAAQMISQVLDVKLREGLMKNRYIGRTFIMPNQPTRRDNVRRKLNPIQPEFEGKNVLLVDDSIVRGTTSQQLVDLARQSGARKVYFASAAPPVRYPNYYGIDIPDSKELIAKGRDVEGVRDAIGADWLIYQDLADLKQASQIVNPDIRNFECSVFDGNYITESLPAKESSEAPETLVAKSEASARATGLHAMDSKSSQ